MRVLWVKPGGLWPPNTGGRQRSLRLLSELSTRHRVVLATTCGPAPGDDPAGLAAHLAACERVVSVPFTAPKQGSARFAGALARSWLTRWPVDLFKWRSRALRRAVGDLVAGGAWDVIVADFLVAVPNVMPRGPVPVVHFSHNVEHLIWKRLHDVERGRWRRAALAVEWRKMRRAEAAACRACDLTIAVSDADRDRLRAIAPGAAVESVPTGVDTTYFAPAAEAGRPGHLVFSGSMDWAPNEDAMHHFVHEILPRVRRVRPDVTLAIVGRRPGPRVRALGAQPGVHVTGTVDDVRPWVRDAAVVIVPLRVGGGTRLKIFEALAMGKAVLSTSVGAEGLGTIPGLHLEIADGAEAFASAVVALLDAGDRRRRLGDAGRALVTAHYGWPSVARVFEARLTEAAAARPAGPVTARRTAVA